MVTVGARDEDNDFQGEKARIGCLSRRGRCDPGGSLIRSQHHHERARLHPAVEIDHIFISQPDAARRNRVSDPSRLVRAVDAIERVLAVGVEVERARPHSIAP